MLSGYFQFAKRHTSFKTEAVAGLTTFLTMACIIFVNPNILSEAGMDKDALIAVTCIVSTLATIAVVIFATSSL